MRELIQAGDPMMRIRLPIAIEKLLKDEAKKNRRRHQDELIKRINMMIKADTMLKETQSRLTLQLMKIYQS